MRVYVFLETKAAAYRAIKQIVLDININSRPLIITGDYDIFFKIETKDEDTLYNEIQRILASPTGMENITRTSTFIITHSDKQSPFIVDEVPTYVVFIRTIPTLTKQVMEDLRKHRDIIMANMVYGDYDIIAELRSDPKRIEDAIYEIQAILGIKKTSTIQVLHGLDRK